MASNLTLKHIEVQSKLREDLQKRIDGAKDYNELFEIVKRLVDMVLGMHRAGLALILRDMPPMVGAYYPVGSNTIVLNRALIAGMRRISSESREINSFILVVLMHEYLHSLGFLDEGQVRIRTEKICKDILGEDHLSVKLSRANWLERHPELQMISSQFSNRFEAVDKFDSSSSSYIG